MTDRQIMQQSLEALEADEHDMVPDQEGHMVFRKEAAITALRERLAQPEPPVLTGIDCSCGKKWRILNNTLTASEPETVMAAYKHQTYAAYKTGGEMKIGVVPEQEPVCAHDIPKTKCSFCRVEYKQPDHDWEAEYTKQVELHNQTLDELRDALAQPEQEPVAWMIWTQGPVSTFLKKYEAESEFDRLNRQYPEPSRKLIALYTTPPRREWVGLTRDEVLDIEETAKHPLDFARSIEAKLREKNNG